MSHLTIQINDKIKMFAHANYIDAVNQSISFVIKNRVKSVHNPLTAFPNVVSH